MSLDSHYDNRAAVPTFADFLSRWNAASQAARAQASTGKGYFSQHPYLKQDYFNPNELCGAARRRGAARVARLIFTPRRAKAGNPSWFFCMGATGGRWGRKSFISLHPLGDHVG
jgi:hypothetical protein